MSLSLDNELSESLYEDYPNLSPNRGVGEITVSMYGWNVKVFETEEFSLVTIDYIVR